MSRIPSESVPTAESATVPVAVASNPREVVAAIGATIQSLGSSPNGAADAKLFSVVIPAYNEEGNILKTYERLAGVLAGIGLEWEIIFSVDPSTDRTEEIILELRKRDPRVKLLRFSRRFGQPAATIAGLEAAKGDAVVVIDCDLQDPPELIPALVEQWRLGYDVVYAQRRTRQGETLVKRMIASLGYRLIARISEVNIPPNTGDFRLMTRRVVNNVVALQEQNGFLRGLVGLVGFSGICVQYDRDERTAGSGKYNRFTGSILIGLNGVVGFSRYPLQVISIFGIVIASLAFLLGLSYFCSKLAGVDFPVGNPTIVILVSFFSGIQLLSLGVIGEYIGRIYDEVRHRPKYIVESAYGFEPPAPPDVSVPDRATSPSEQAGAEAPNVNEKSGPPRPGEATDAPG